MASPYENARIAIVGYFQAGFVAAVPAGQQPNNPPDPFLPFSLPNYRIDPPTDSMGNPAPYCRLTINEGRTLPRDVGGGSTRTPGIVYLQIFLPENTGTTVARKAADLMSTLFQYVILELPDGVLRFREVSFRGGLGAINGYDRSNVEIEFQRDAYTDGGSPAIVQTALNAANGVSLPNAQLGADGVLRILNTTTGTYQSFQITGEPGQETISIV